MREPSSSGLTKPSYNPNSLIQASQAQNQPLQQSGVQFRTQGGPLGGPGGPPPIQAQGPGSLVPSNPSLGQLQDMAMRQQHQIEAQQQMLVAKEQRLKYLRQQDFKQNQMAAEYERLRRLREKVFKKFIKRHT